MPFLDSLHYEIYRKWSQFKLRNKFIPSHEKRVEANYTDLYFLYKNVRERKPQVVFEFGSGYSTLILTYALSDNMSGKLYSMEDNHYWFLETKKLIPQHLLKFCDVIESPAEEVRDRVLRYTIVPDVAPDFVYLDGPSTLKSDPITLNVLEIEEKLPIGFFLVIDGRKKNVEFYRKELRRSYIFKNRKAFANSTFTLIR